MLLFKVLSTVYYCKIKSLKSQKRDCKPPREMHHGKCGFKEANVLIGHHMTFHLSRGLKTSGGWRGKLSRHTGLFSVSERCVNVFHQANPAIIRLVTQFGHIWLLLHFSCETLSDLTAAADCPQRVSPRRHTVS